jgi:hypothetical protein
VRDLTSSAVAGFVASAGALFAPFVLTTPLSRGSVSDAVALAALPFALWSVERVLRVPGRRRAVVSGVILAALVLSHNVTGLVGFGLACGYAAAGLLRGGGRRAAVHLGAALLLGAGLSAFFWLPAFADRGWTRLDVLIATPQFDYHNSFVPLGTMFRFPERAIEGLMNPPAPYHIQAALLALATLGVARVWMRRRESRARLSVLWGCGVALLALCLPQSVRIWERIPALAMVQFPFRFLGPAAIVLAAPAGALFAADGAQSGGRRWVRRVGMAGAVLLLVVPSIPAFYPLVDTSVHGETLADLTVYQQTSGALGTTSVGEYLPKAAEALPNGPAFPGMDLGASFASKLDEGSLPNGARIVTSKGGPLGAEWTISSPAAFRAQVRTFFFPGWRATIDGGGVPVTPTPGRGLIQVEVPAGEHLLRIEYAGTVASRWGDALSLATVLIAGLLVLWPRRKGKAGMHEPPAAVRLSSRSAIACAAVGLGLLAAKAGFLDRVDSPWRLRYDGTTAPGAEQTVGVDLGGQIRLLALDSAPASVTAGAQIHLILYWSALAPVDKSYRATVQILDDQGEKIGQEDHYWPGGYPTLWWRPGEFNRDAYSVSLSERAKPGTYTIVVALYDDGGRRLSVPGDSALARQGLLAFGEIRVAGDVPAPAPPP